METLKTNRGTGDASKLDFDQHSRVGEPDKQFINPKQTREEASSPNHDQEKRVRWNKVFITLPYKTLFPQKFFSPIRKVLQTV